MESNDNDEKKYSFIINLFPNRIWANIIPFSLLFFISLASLKVFIGVSNNQIKKPEYKINQKEKSQW